MENNLIDRPKERPRHRMGRSSVSNGKRLFSGDEGLDGRSQAVRRFRDLIEDISGDLGGKATLSEGQRQLIRRAAMLSAECERQEALAARGEAEFNCELYGTMCDRLGRLFGRLGLQRVARETILMRRSRLQRTRRNDGRPVWAAACETAAHGPEHSGVALLGSAWSRPATLRRAQPCLSPRPAPRPGGT
jgi:hypothetical protein